MYFSYILNIFFVVFSPTKQSFTQYIFIGDIYPTVGSMGKRICLQCRRCGFNPWLGKISWRRAWQPTPVFLPAESHGQRSLAGYSPWGHTESGMTKATQHTYVFHCAQKSAQNISSQQIYIGCMNIYFTRFGGLMTETSQRIKNISPLSARPFFF